VARELENAAGKEVDYTDGIFQSIGLFVTQFLGPRASPNLFTGYKEFQAYLAAEDQPQVLFDEAVDLMKVATRKYAAHQVKWIHKRLLPAVDAVKTTDPASMYSYVLDTSSMLFALTHSPQTEPNLKMQTTGQVSGIQL
jgi:tRNA A37 N6-isopentenylltransferase MiaA